MTEKKEREEQLKALRVELSELYKKRQEGKDVPRDLTRIDEISEEITRITASQWETGPDTEKLSPGT
jgi:hypothetical protein